MTSRSQQSAMIDAIGHGLRQDPKALVIAAHPPETGPQAPTNLSERVLLKTFGPERILDMPYAPSTVIGTSLGAAANGVRVVADLTAIPWPDGLIDGLMRQESLLRSRNATGGPGLPLIIRCPIGPARGPAQALAGLALQTGLLDVALPAEPGEAHGLMIAAFARTRPVLILDHDGLKDRTGPVPPKPEPIPFGAARIVRPGTDLTLVAFSAGVHDAIDLARDVDDDHGVSCEVIDPRTAAPFDAETLIASVERTGRLVILEDGPAQSAMAAEIAALIAERAASTLIAPVRRLRQAESTASARSQICGLMDALAD